MIDLKPWLIEQSLPFWHRQGWDARHGGVHERFLFSGEPDLEAIKRVRVQARQIYSYSHAAVLGWYPEGTAFALDLLDWMVAKARSPDGRPGFVHLLHPDGSVANPLRDTYDHMFVLLSLAWLARASGDAQVRGLLDETLALVDEHLTAPDGTLLEGIPSSLPRRQNPHMHCFEAMMGLYEALDYPGALDRAARLHALFQTRFLVPAPKLREYFTDAWEVAPGREGESVEPGHQVEWTWLLHRYRRLTGRSSGSLPGDLLDDALATSDPATGFLVDETDCHGAVRRATRRMWPQTELVKAWLVEAESGRQGAWEKAEEALSALDDTYLSKPFAAGWIDQFDADGKPAIETVPASTLYHVLGMIIEVDRVSARRA
ncbi:AGE family epimerase/isomerase [Microvirga pudoricolor]|uniref:AGE family epimerase/isomerase n=1 Tax=Microvirga pudoricolor TaxID=2778729 RepID=UPI001950D18A|nr:AGE family epimerase/isomerase [Microvirga pudoricolor]MBM6592836.1 AGE family epimerase/isomerase [Microvirga pudoricolor]